MTTPTLETALFWFRRDLRATDNAGLFHALKSARQVRCVFGASKRRRGRVKFEPKSGHVPDVRRETEA